MYQKVILIGNLGKDPELRQTSNGSEVCSFPLATTEKYTDRNGEKRSVTEWHDIVVWGGMAGVCNNFLHKGATVNVEGKLKTRVWEDRNGEKRYRKEVICTNIVFIKTRRNDNDGFNQDNDYSNRGDHNNGNNTSSGSNGPDGYECIDDDLPF